MTGSLLIKERILKTSHMWVLSSTVYYVLPGNIFLPLRRRRKAHSFTFGNEFLKRSVRNLSDELRSAFKREIPVWRVDYA